MRKSYTAPEAQLICLAPSESIAAGWQSPLDSWWTNGFFWGATPTENVSAPNNVWYDFGLDELAPDTTNG